MKLQWNIKDWSSLTTDELYDILALRIEVFVIEQNCPYQDADGKDKKSRHLFAMNQDGAYVACLRIVQPRVSYEEISIGRVVTSPKLRGTGIGKELMQRAIDIITQEGNPPVRISAQSHLQKFYEGFGFVKVSEEYLEDDIPHVEMLRSQR
jgi:ElaA protein